MKKLFLISLFILISCSNQDKILMLKVDCENNISIKKKVLDYKEIREIVKKHRFKFKSEAKFKIEACKQTSVKVLIDLKNIIEPK